MADRTPPTVKSMLGSGDSERGPGYIGTCDSRDAAGPGPSESAAYPTHRQEHAGSAERAPGVQRHRDNRDSDTPPGPGVYSCGVHTGIASPAVRVQFAGEVHRGTTKLAARRVVYTGRAQLEGGVWCTLAERKLKGGTLAERNLKGACGVHWQSAT